MRIYTIGNDGITLCREPPATVNKGEIAVASREKLHGARLSGKRLLTLWNALPDVEKQTKVGDRDTLIDQLWSAIEALPDPDRQSDTKRPSKQERLLPICARVSMRKTAALRSAPASSATLLDLPALSCWR
jgi:hypothetical protein